MPKAIRLDLNVRAGLVFVAALFVSWLAIRLATDGSAVQGDGSAPSAHPASKIILARRGDSHEVEVSSGEREIVLNLDWNKLGRGLGAADAVDLDFGCFYELADGTRSVVDGLQFANGQGGARHVVSRQGCYTKAPWIWHTGDDRTGDQLVGGESFLINPAGFSEVRRIAIYALIYDGVERWSETDAVVSVVVPDGPTIEVRLGDQAGPGRLCVIAVIDVSDRSALGKGPARTLGVAKEVVFFDGHKEAANAYGFDMLWQAGSK